MWNQFSFFRYSCSCFKDSNNILYMFSKNHSDAFILGCLSSVKLDILLDLLKIFACQTSDWLSDLFSNSVLRQMIAKVNHTFETLKIILLDKISRMLLDWFVTSIDTSCNFTCLNISENLIKKHFLIFLLPGSQKNEWFTKLKQPIFSTFSTENKSLPCIIISVLSSLSINHS